jgi:tripartite-type tricarboxylate transporter receptor subunit TctC
MLGKIAPSALKMALAGAALLAASFASAQDYPLKPIRMVIPYTTGGSIDTVGRLLADQLQRQLGQPIVIENAPGASGLLGAMNVKKGQARRLHLAVQRFQPSLPAAGGRQKDLRRAA